jgi:predicted anti-sigma-YlaC factor YlaD
MPSKADVRTFFGDCERARQWISSGLDGELSKFESALLDGHLSGCRACATFMAETRGLTSTLRTAPLERFDVRVAPQRRHRLALRLSPVAASLAVVAVGVGSILASVRVGPFVGGHERQESRVPANFGVAPTNDLRQAGRQRVVKIHALHQRAPKRGPVAHS